METLIYDKQGEDTVRCGICNHFCVIKKGKKGRCAVRENKAGKLKSLSYSNVVAASVDPIEKKPIFHLKPGSLSYSIAAPGCNFKCSFCQNANIAQISLDGSGMPHGRSISPEAIVEAAIQSKCQSISYTYTEPTVFFELALDTAKIARENGLLNVFVTNGFMSPRALEMIGPVLDAANVDLKAFDNSFYQKFCKAELEPVKATLKQMKQMGVIVEITTLLIPGINDQMDEICDMAGYIVGELGPQTPWHISRFHPTHRMTDRPVTPVESLEAAYDAGKKAGLEYVYIGNVPGGQWENTVCHHCGQVLIQRHGYTVKNDMAQGGRCPGCDTRVYGEF